MIPTLSAARQGWTIPPSSTTSDIDAWMARWTGPFNRNAYGAPAAVARAKVGRSKHRQLETSFKKAALLPSPPISPSSAFSRGRTPASTPAAPPTLTPSSSTSSTTSSSSSDVSHLFTTEYFEVRKSPKGGWGAFAVRDIEKDTTIISEKPLFVATFVEVFYEYEKLTAEQRKEYRSLHGWEGVDNNRILAIFKTNRFEITLPKSGIYLKSSRFNHACREFATCTYSINQEDENILNVKARQSIKAGDEITISYGDAAHLYSNYGFRCDCPACPPPAKAKEDEELRKYGPKRK